MQKRRLILYGMVGFMAVLLIIIASCAGATPETEEAGVIAQPVGWQGGYLGVETCAVCHDGSIMPDVVSQWEKTGHATKFEDTFARYSEESSFCIACHTTGYDEENDNGGFDDLARAAGWDPAKENIGSWVASKGLEGVKKSVAGRLINVQCESCHGGATNKEGDMHQYSVDWTDKTCNVCHSQNDQLQYASHVIGAEVGGGNAHTAGASCAYCHTGQGYVVHTINGEEITYPDTATPDKPANMLALAAQPVIACPTCHDPHSATFPEEEKQEDGSIKVFSKQLRAWGNVDLPAGVTVDASVSATCVNCHHNKRDVAYHADFIASKQSRGPHQTMADVFYGVGADDFNGAVKFTNSIHTTLVKDGCVSCHMAANPAPLEGATEEDEGVISSHGELMLATTGGHSFNMVGDYKGQEIENIGSCMTVGCHAQGTITTFNRTASGDYDGDGKIKGIQDEVQGLLDILAAELPKDKEGNIPSSDIDKMNLTETQLTALWNYTLIANDGSLGIHNTAFAVQVLQKTYKQLTGNDIPGATLR